MRALVLLGLILLATSLHAETAVPGLVSGGTYILTAKSSGKALTVEGSTPVNGTNVYQWTDTGTTAQQWKIDYMGDGHYRLMSISAQRMLDVNAGSLVDGGNVHVWSDAANNNQRWKIVDAGGGWFKLIAKVSGKCLDVTGAGTADGTNVQQWTDSGSSSQRWRFTLLATPGFSSSPVTPGGYCLTAKHSGLLLSIPAGSTAEGVQATQATNAEAAWQRWLLEDAGGGTFKLRAKHSNKVLTIAGGSTANGAQLQQSTDVSANTQKWFITPSPGDWLVISSVATSKVVDVSGVRTDSGAPVHQWTSVGGANQLWKLTPFYDLTLTAVPLTLVLAKGDIVTVTPQMSGLVTAYEACGVATVSPFNITTGTAFKLPTSSTGFFTYRVTNAQGTEIGLIEATVVSTDLADVPIADQYGYTRQVIFHVAPKGAPITYTSSSSSLLSVSEHTETISSASLLLTPRTVGASYVVAAIPGPLGWRTMSRRKVDSFSIETDSKTVIHVRDLLEDGTQVAEATLTMTPLIRDLSMKMTTFVSGVTFLDGTTLFNGSTNLFIPVGSSGTYPYGMLRAPTGHPNFCHTFTLYQSGQQISRGW